MHWYQGQKCWEVHQAAGTETGDSQCSQCSSMYDPLPSAHAIHNDMHTDHYCQCCRSSSICMKWYQSIRQTSIDNGPIKITVTIFRLQTVNSKTICKLVMWTSHDLWQAVHSVSLVTIRWCAVDCATRTTTTTTTTTTMTFCCLVLTS